jgi:5-methylcytosine-specific restriction endonuclease McrA
MTDRRRRVATLKSRVDRARYGSDWVAVRDDHLAMNPVCHCDRVRVWSGGLVSVVPFDDPGRIAPAVMVDHIQPLSAGGARLDVGNLQSLCARCHALKTRRYG